MLCLNLLKLVFAPALLSFYVNHTIVFDIVLCLIEFWVWHYYVFGDSASDIILCLVWWEFLLPLTYDLLSSGMQRPDQCTIIWWWLWWWWWRWWWWRWYAADDDDGEDDNMMVMMMIVVCGHLWPAFLRHPTLSQTSAPPLLDKLCHAGNIMS